MSANLEFDDLRGTGALVIYHPAKCAIPTKLKAFAFELLHHASPKLPVKFSKRH